MFRFAYPAALSLLLLPLLYWIFYRTRRLILFTPALYYSATDQFNQLPQNWRVRLRHLPNVLLVGAWGMLIIMLAQPQSGQVQEIIRGEGIEIVMALDVSTSMAALDFAPQNRLEAAKSVISRFINGREFDPIGLVIFAQESFQQTPPTLDYQTLLHSINELQLASEMQIEDGTAIGLGIASAGNMLRDRATASKIIILLTDGANNAGSIGPLTAAQAVAAFGIRIYTIGMGRTGTIPIPIDNSGNTRLIESDLDEASLQTIAQVSGGQFFRAEDISNLQAVYDQINRLERSEVERQLLTRWQDNGWLLLWGSLLCLMIERGLRHTLFQSVP